jgi:hypothetical protein
MNLPAAHGFDVNQSPRPPLLEPKPSRSVALGGLMHTRPRVSPGARTPGHGVIATFSTPSLWFPNRS